MIPLQDFFRNPERTSFRLSPDGRHLAWLQPWRGHLNVHVRPIDGESVTRVTESTARDIPTFLWANDERLVFFQDRGGDENFHAYAVDLDGEAFLDLTPFEGVQARLVDRLRDDDEHVLVAINRRDPRAHDVFRLHVESGEALPAAENPGNVTAWWADHSGRVRAAVATDGVDSTLLFRETEDDAFTAVLTTGFRDTLRPLCFTFDDSLLYVASNLERDTLAVYTFDPRRGRLLDLVYEHPEVDVHELQRSHHRRTITAATFFTDRRGCHFFDRDRRQLQERLEEHLPGVEVVVADLSRDERRVLVRTFSDKTQGAYYFLNRDTDELETLAEVSPWLDPAAMADMEPVRYPSRDGLTIHGYLTLPRGREPRALPVVIHPHGGPWHRDYWGFDPEVQFLASRGYAVLQMNFRGSTGYGKEFWAGSFRQWGRRMQDDVTDGVRWLIDRSVADPERIGIYGGSYGGYATLAGLAFTPDLYACGVDYVGVSNLFTWMKAFPPYWKPMLAKIAEMVGDPEGDPEHLRAVSPFFHADRIQAPLLVAQGANDPRVTKTESDQIVGALRERGIDVEYMVKEDEGHGFASEANRFDFYAAMERFLAKHLGGSTSG